MNVHIGFVEIYVTDNCCVLQTHYFEFQLALNKTLIHAIATHPLTNNTLPAPQKAKLGILPLPPLLFDKGFTISKLINFPSWETMRVCFTANKLFRGIELELHSESSPPQPLSYRQLLRPPNALGGISAGLKKDFTPCHRHPLANK